jgi:oxygen-independent coproporphyrinogen-3 oxidase
VDLKNVAREFGEAAIGAVSESIADCLGAGLLERESDVVRLTPRGRLLSNEVFERFILTPQHSTCRR